MIRLHRWRKIADRTRRCRVCGLTAQKRPHPYRRSWWTEWHWMGGGRDRWANSLNGDRPPACTTGLSG